MLKNPVDSLPKVDVRVDPRFSLEYNWDNVVVPNIKECQGRGIIVTPLTVFNAEGGIEGWQLQGWKAPPPIFLYKED